VRVTFVLLDAIGVLAWTLAAVGTVRIIQLCLREDT
jgi:hypothetical protein